MLVARFLRPRLSVTPESHRPVVVTGAKVDFVLRDRSVSITDGDGNGEDSSGVGGPDSSEEGAMTVWEGMTARGNVADSTDGRSMGAASVNSFMRSNSTLDFIRRSSTASTSVWSSKATPCFFLKLPVKLWRAVPVELARDERVLVAGVAGVMGLADVGEAGTSLKLARRGSFSILGLNMRGNERRFSSELEAGDGERGQSRADMETVRTLGERKMAFEPRTGVEDWLGGSAVNSRVATQTPEMRIKCRRASSVSMGSFAVRLSMKVSTSICGDSIVGDWV